MMKDAALGLKRKCLDCGAPFFDLQRDPIVCPKCKSVFVPPPVAPAPYVRKAVPVAAPVPEPEPESADGEVLLNDDDEENLESGDDETGADIPAEDDGDLQAEEE